MVVVGFDEVVNDCEVEFGVVMVGVFGAGVVEGFEDPCLLGLWDVGVVVDDVHEDVAVDVVRVY